jgi:RNA polymerase sigma-70 factor (ECF subfamily)
VSELSEAELRARAQRGDRDAWGALIARHDHRVVLALVARGVRIDEAREFAHRAWIRLIEQQRAGRLAQLELPGLAIRQAGFLALDEARRRAAAGQSHPDAGAALLDPDATAEDRLIHREALQRARDELSRCSPQARRLFELIYANPGMPHAEVARTLGLSVQRVRQSLCELRARLRAAIDPESSDV